MVNGALASDAAYIAFDVKNVYDSQVRKYVANRHIFDYIRMNNNSVLITMSCGETMAAVEQAIARDLMMA